MWRNYQKMYEMLINMFKEFIFHNLFINLAAFAKKRIERCTSYCISCGKKLIDESARLSPCRQPFCLFKFEEIFGVKLIPEMQTNLPLVQLDLSLASKAVFSARALDIFEPFPTFFLKQSEQRERSVFGGETFLEVKKENKDIDRMKKIFHLLPSLNEILLSVASEDEFKNYLKALYTTNDMILAYKFFTYVVATNRLSLVQLDKSEQIQAFGAGCIQFIVTNQNPEFEKKFEISKKKVFIIEKSIFLVWLKLFVSWKWPRKLV